MLALRLTRTLRTGPRESVELDPRSVLAALEGLDPARHAHLHLHDGSRLGEPGGPGLSVMVWPITRREGCLGTGVLSGAIREDSRYLGRLRPPIQGDPRIPLRHGWRNERTISVQAEVPLTWIANALGAFIRGEGFTPLFPWFRRSFFTYLGDPWAERYAFTRVEDAAPETRRVLLTALHAALLERWTQAEERPGAMSEAIAELRRVGHDLWSLDVHGDGGQTWGADYMRPAEGAGLRIAYGREDEGRGAPWLSLRFGELEIGEEPEFY